MTKSKQIAVYFFFLIFNDVSKYTLNMFITFLEELYMIYSDRPFQFQHLLYNHFIKSRCKLLFQISRAQRDNVTTYWRTVPFTLMFYALLKASAIQPLSKWLFHGLTQIEGNNCVNISFYESIVHNYLILVCFGTFSSDVTSCRKKMYFYVVRTTLGNLLFGCVVILIIRTTEQRRVGI